MTCELEVVTYDPVRRKGFMRFVAPPISGRVHFALGMLPESFKRSIIDASRAFNAKDLPRDRFQEVSRRVRSLVVRSRFRATVRSDRNGTLHLVRRSVQPGDPPRALPLTP